MRAARKTGGGAGPPLEGCPRSPSEARRRGSTSEAPARCSTPAGKDPTLMPRAVTLIRSAALSDVAEYAYAATAPAEARLIFLAGACPLNEDGSTAAVGDYAGQTAKALENMRLALAAAG